MIDEKEMQKMKEFLKMLPFEAFIDENGELIEDEIVNLVPDRIEKHGRTTVVFWEDGTATAVRRSPDEPDNDYAAFTAAVTKRVYGNNSQIKSIIRELTVKPTAPEPLEQVQKTAAEAMDEIGKAFRKFAEETGGVAQTQEKDACHVDKPCKENAVEFKPVHKADERTLTKEDKSYLDWVTKDLNEKAKAQYAAHVNGMWTCPNCGKTYPWQNGRKGRFATCFRCNTAAQQTAQQ